MPTDTRYFHSGMAGAPVLNNAPGSLLAVLRACLRDGFNTKTVDSLVIAGGVATVTIASGHGFTPVAEYAELAGGNEAQAMGTKKVVTVPNAQTFTFDATGLPNQTVTGAMTCKRAPIGSWVEEFNSGNVSAFKSTHPQASGFRLQVDDSATAESALVRAFESMTSATVGTAPFPSVAAQANCYFSKGQNTAAAKTWVLVGDKRRFYWAFGNAGTGTAYLPSFFGETNPLRFAGDLYSCALMASAAVGGSHFMHALNNGASTIPTAWAFARLASGVPGAGQMLGLQGFHAALSSVTFNIGEGSNYPDAVTGGTLIHTPLLLREVNVSANYPYRAAMPGMLQPLSRIGATFQTMTIVPMDDVNRYPSGLLHLPGAGNTSTAITHSATPGASFLFDLDNPW